MRHSGFYGFMWTDTRSGQLVNPSPILWSLACLFESTKLGKVCCAVGIPEYTEEPILGNWVPGIDKWDGRQLGCRVGYIRE
jgi:hypothetical protein